jgi:hypothetical protein
MDNKAYEQYRASQPVVAPQRPEPAPPWQATVLEITIIIVFVIVCIYAVYRAFRDSNKKP